MADLTFSSYAQGPLGEAIVAVENMDTLPAPVFTPSVTLLGPGPETEEISAIEMHLLGPGDVAGLVGATVVRNEPPSGAVDVEPNYLASVDLTPVELPWVLTPAKAAGGRLRPWLVLVVLEAATAPLKEGRGPLPTVDADIGQLPDLRDSWGWAHIQKAVGGDELVGGARAAGSVARLVCPRHLEAGKTYRACVVPAFASGVAAGLGSPPSQPGPHELAWKVEAGGSVELPLYHHWTFTTGPDGDFEELVTRLQPADPESLRVSSSRPVDIRAPWPGDQPLADATVLVGVQGALRPFTEPPIPEPAATPEVLAELDRRLRAQLDAPAQRLLHEPADDTVGTLAPPLYGARHVSRDLVESDPAWIAQLNASVANRIAAGLGSGYVRTHQEDLMAKAWEQVGAIREANRLRATVELTTAVAERVHERHVAPLTPGEVLSLAAPARALVRTSDSTTLSMELRMSCLTDGAASSAFARRMRPAGKLARRTGASVSGLLPRGLSGEVGVPTDTAVIPPTPAIDASGVGVVMSSAAANQLMVMSAMVSVAALNDVAGGTDLGSRIGGLGLGDEVTSLAAAGDIGALATAISGQMESVTTMTAQVLEDMTGQNAFGSVTQNGVPIEAQQIAGRVSEALFPAESHWARLASQTVMPDRLRPVDPTAPVMAYPQFPVPTALALLDSDPEWFMPGLGKLPANRVALLAQNSPFIESYLVGINHEMMRELLWREYPTDRRGTPFNTFWPRPDRSPDIAPINTWTDPAALGDRLLQDEALAILLVRGDVLRRYPGVVVTAVRSGPPDAAGKHLPDPHQPALPPSFVIRVDDQTNAYAFTIQEQELRTPASPEAPGWFFVFAENGFRIRFGFDEPPTPGEPPLPGDDVVFDSWNDVVWPPREGAAPVGAVPVARGHAIAGQPFDLPGALADQPLWNRDAADIARITLQRPFRIAVQADVLLQPREGV